MMKKILALAAAAVLALSLAACGATGEQLPALELPSASSGVESGQEVSSVADTDFEDNLEGLCAYLEANYAIAGEPVEMAYETIGAVGGVRYRFQYNGVTIQAEFYEFDLDNLNETAQACLDSVRENGSFVVLEDQVPAALSGKYLMIYTDANNSEENTAQRERVAQLFQSFKGE